MIVATHADARAELRGHVERPRSNRAEIDGQPRL